MRYEDVPGPHAGILGNLTDIAGHQVHEVLAGWAAEYGDLVAFRVLDTPWLLINDPAMVGEVLETRHDAFFKHAPVKELRPIVRQSVFIANGEEWASKRPRHPFSSSWMEGWMRDILPVVRDLIVGRLAGWNGRVEIVEALRRLAFDCFSIGVLGEILDDAIYDAHNALYDDASTRLTTGGIFEPFSLDPLAPLDRHAWWDFIASRVSAPRDPAARDLLSRIRASGTELPEPLLIDEIGTIFLAGAGPVAVAMTAVLHELAGAPRVADALAAAPAEGPVQRVVDEALRLWPTVTVLGRQPRAPMTIGDLEVPAELQIFVSPWAMHRDARRWPEPLSFSPERFEATPAPWTYLPFGAGPRTCLGRPWALFLTRLLTTLAAPRLRLARTDEALHLKYYAGFAIPDAELHLDVARR
jgi:cytochrome P450